MEKYEYTMGCDGQDDQKFETQDDAMQACWKLARKYADFLGIEDLVEWGDDEQTGWGVCPDGDDGAYWPQVSAKEV
jgi:hypothetical protein